MSEQVFNYSSQFMSKRSFIAAKAMEALINAQFSNLPESIQNNWFLEKEQLIEAAFSYADEFLKQEFK